MRHQLLRRLTPTLRHWLGALALLVGLATIMPVAQAAPCVANCLVPGDHTVTMFSGGLPRTYYIHVPASYDGTREVPLVIDFHGFSSNADEERTYSGQREQSDRRGFIVVYPDGIGRSWNGYGCCAAANAVWVNDVGFARSAIAAVKARANIDASRVFATGISNGGSMAMRMACEAADIIRAVASVSFPLNTNTCRPSRPIGVTEIHATGDTTIAYDGGGGLAPGLLPPTIAGIPFGVQGARASLAAWKGIDGCSDTIDRVQLVAGSRSETYVDCQDGVKVGLVTIAGGKHVLYNGYVGLGYTGATDNSPIDVSEYIWENVFNL